MKKILSFALAVAMFFTIAGPASASGFEEDCVSSTKYYVDEETRRADIQRQLEDYMSELLDSSAQTMNGYDYQYISEYGLSQFVTAEGYPGGQPTKGVKFSPPGGGFTWNPDGGPTQSFSLTFAYPFNVIPVTVSIGVATAGQSGGVGYYQVVDNYTDYVKLYVEKTMEIVPVIVYKENIYTGERTVYMKNYLSTMYSYEMEYRVV